MDLSVKPESRLEVSVSFGRFEKDALSWEKWSSFSQNKYLEEVGTLSTPGSVAQKKAYFEAHYKKIAAQKAEVLEQEKLIDSHGSSNGVYVNNVSDRFNGSIASNGAKLEEEFVEESRLSISSYDAITKLEDDIVYSFGECGSTSVKDAVEEFPNVAIAENVGSCRIVEVVNEHDGTPDHPERNPINDAGLEKVDSRKIASAKNAIKEKSRATKTKSSNSNHAGSVIPKVTPIKKDRNLAGTKKDVASPASRSSKPASISTPASTTLSSKKKLDGSAQPKSKTSLPGDNKRVVPTSLHMSLNSGPANSFASHSMLRKSPIMENMGDKDIVRRAFKAFQKRNETCVSAEKPVAGKHELSSPAEPRKFLSHTPIKGNERPKKDSEKTISSNPSGSGSNLLPGSHKKYATNSSPRVSSNDRKVEKKTELVDKLEAKPSLNVAENAKHKRNSKVVTKNEKPQ